MTACPGRARGTANGSVNPPEEGLRGHGVKYRISSSLLISGNERSCSSWSWENIFSDKTPPHARAEPNRNRTKPRRSATVSETFVIAGQWYIRWKFLQYYWDPCSGR